MSEGYRCDMIFINTSGVLNFLFYNSNQTMYNVTVYVYIQHKVENFLGCVTYINTTIPFTQEPMPLLVAGEANTVRINTNETSLGQIVFGYIWIKYNITPSGSTPSHKLIGKIVTKVE